MGEVNFSRRAFLLGSVVLTATAAATWCKRKADSANAQELGEEAFKTLVGLHRFSGDAKEVALGFANAPTALLLSSYEVFFPRFMAARVPWNVPMELESTIAEIHVDKNQHRLAALPSVAAAHAISLTPASKQEPLWDRIADSIKNGNREIREIVLQNLITSSLPSPDRQQRWSASGRLLSCAIDVIKQSEQAPQLISPASMALTFLLNTRATLASKADTSARAGLIDKQVLEPDTADRNAFTVADRS